MGSRIMDTLTMLEDRIENIKWLITTSFFTKRSGVSTAINSIRKSAGILGKNSTKGIVFENKVRRSWKANFARRIS